jgi:hypothetical protein
MTEPTNSHARAERALRSLGDAIATGTTVPAAGDIRAHAERWRRARRTGTALAAAAAVAALAVGGAQVVTLASGTPPPAADTPPPTAPPPTPTATPAPPVDDPIAAVDWRHAAIDLPASGHCPSGPVQLAPVTRGGSTFPATESQGLRLQIFAGPSDIAYGDLTGDGRIEATIVVNCLPADQLDGAGEGLAQLLVVARDRNGTLTGLRYVGPRGAAYRSWWIEHHTLLVHLSPWRTDPPELLPEPGLVLGYQWDGQDFVELQPVPPLVPLGPDQPAPVVLTGPVAEGLGCPDVSLRFQRPDEQWRGRASAAGARFTVPTFHDQDFLFDLAPDGAGPLLVTGIECRAPDGASTFGLAVFAPTGSLGWQGLAVVPHPGGGDGARWRDSGDGRLLVEWSGQDGPVSFRWTGTALVPAE